MLLFIYNNYWLATKIRSVSLKFLYFKNFYIAIYFAKLVRHHLIELQISASRICFTNYGTMIFNGVMSKQSQNPCLT